MAEIIATAPGNDASLPDTWARWQIAATLIVPAARDQQHLQRDAVATTRLRPIWVVDFYHYRPEGI